MEKLGAGTSMGTVDLLVRDLERVTAYYHDGVGLDVLEQRGETVTLGCRGNPRNIEVIRLTRDARLPGFHRGGAGLFHTAILFDTQADLAAAVLSTVRHAPTSFTGSADHLVSEAFYFDDPEGNGVELYVDRPRAQWRYEEGRVDMATLPLDPNAFLETHLRDGSQLRDAGDPVVGGADVGHVHLQVGDIPEAEAFYAGVLGFDVTARYGAQALFIAAGGYHHHIGLNTWNSRGAGPRAASLGLERVAIEVPTTEEIDRIADRLGACGMAAERRHDSASAGTSLVTADPWGTRIEIHTGNA